MKEKRKKEQQNKQIKQTTTKAKNKGVSGPEPSRGGPVFTNVTVHTVMMSVFLIAIKRNLLTASTECRL